MVAEYYILHYFLSNSTAFKYKIQSLLDARLDFCKN